MHTFIGWLIDYAALSLVDYLTVLWCYWLACLKLLLVHWRRVFTGNLPEIWLFWRYSLFGSVRPSVDLKTLTNYQIIYCFRDLKSNYFLEATYFINWHRSVRSWRIAHIVILVMLESSYLYQIFHSDFYAQYLYI